MSADIASCFSFHERQNTCPSIPLFVFYLLLFVDYLQTKYVDYMRIHIHEHLSLTFGQGLKIIPKFDIAYLQKNNPKFDIARKVDFHYPKKKVIARVQDINPVLIASQIKIPLGKSLFTWKVKEKKEKNIWNVSHLGETSVYTIY